MLTDSKPSYGFLQPANGFTAALRYTQMGRAKKRKVPGVMRQVLAENVRASMEREFAVAANKPKELARAAGVTLSTVQRVLEADVGASIDNIESIAKALRSSAYDLLRPSPELRTLLDAPPRVGTLPPADQRLVDQFRRWYAQATAEERRLADLALRGGEIGTFDLPKPDNSLTLRANSEENGGDGTETPGKAEQRGGRDSGERPTDDRRHRKR
jgi:transcriptional regulator with XRE-family HTH domain